MTRPPTPSLMAKVMKIFHTFFMPAGCAMLGYVLDCRVWQAPPGGAGVVPVHRAMPSLRP